VRPGGATRGKWGILDEKDESGLMSDSELQVLSCVLTHTGFIRSHKLSSVDGR
jgi:hypothetical protein